MLQVPLEIAFHNIASSNWAEQEIRARVAYLEKLYDRLISCRIRIDQRAKDRTGTIPPVVHIELGIAGHGDLVVSHEPEHLLRKYRHPTAPRHQKCPTRAAVARSGQQRKPDQVGDHDVEPVAGTDCRDHPEGTPVT